MVCQNYVIPWIRLLIPCIPIEMFEDTVSNSFENDAY